MSILKPCPDTNLSREALHVSRKYQQGTQVRSRFGKG
jgi:hypothetical protein